MKWDQPRLNKWLLLTAAVALMIVSMPVLAQEAAHGEEDGPSTPFEGMKIMNAVVTLLIFILLLVILGRFAWRPMLRVLQDRERFIQESLAEAKADREQAEARLKEYTAKLEAARQEATAIVEEGKRDAEVVKRRIEGDARAEAEAIIVRARREIEIARDHAIQGLYEHTAELATAVAGRIIRKSLSPDDHRALVKEAIEQMEALPPEGSSN